MIGLKENVIIGKLVPAGTGMKCYSDVEIVPVGGPEEDGPQHQSTAPRRMIPSGRRIWTPKTLTRRIRISSWRRGRGGRSA